MDALALSVCLVAALILYSPASAAQEKSTAVQSTSEAESLEWTRIRGDATDLAISANGLVFATEFVNYTWRWRGQLGKGWRLLPGRFTTISADPKGKPWALATDGRIFRYNGLWWDRLGNAKARDIAVGGKGDAFVVTSDGGLAKWMEKEKRWEPIAAEGMARISVDEEGNPWAVSTSGSIVRYKDSSATELPGKARDIAISPEGVAFIATDEGSVARWNAETESWNTVSDIADAKVIAAGPGGFPWIATVDGAIFGTSDFAKVREKEEQPSIGQAPVQDEEALRRARENARRNAIIVLAESTDRSPFVFTAVSREGLGEDIAIGRNGSVFVVDTTGNVLLWSNQQRSFVLFTPRFLHRIAVDPNGNPWGVNGAGNVFRHDGKKWIEIRFIDDAREIAIGGDGSVFVTNREQQLLRYDAARNRFAIVPVPVEASGIAVDPQGAPWIIREDGAVFRCDRDPCERVPDLLGSDIGIGPDGSVFVVNRLNRLLVQREDLTTGEESFLFVRNNVRDVAVGPRGRPWIIDVDRQVFATTFFRTFEEADDMFPEPQQPPPPSAFTFTKRLKFRSVPFDGGNASDITIGRDGSVFLRHVPGFPEVSRYNEKVKRFQRKVENAESAPGCSPPIPVSFTTLATAAEDKDHLWQVGLDAGDRAIVLREPGAAPRDALRKCDVKLSESIPGLGCGDSISVGADGSAFYIGPSCLLYKFNERRDRFILLSPLVTGVAQVAVDPDGVPWVIDTSSDVRKFDGRRFQTMPEGRPAQKASAIAIGANGAVFIIDTNSRLRRYNATSRSFDLITGVQNIFDVAVAPDGLPWVIDGATNRVLRGIP